ncbi:hypothetical protein SAMN03080615_02089 [Amphritea atlantica]|uniref:Uncharacterized protein n=1 Tax=Amphritea atlantica TaxID=355243 RepID=A0A1H9HDP9_9GAMM|nr:hypothetical protein [Amphritea atlantica]SEQ60451.1 hypothetical protein SAMN03080615_02089 [Amphritea atlantica]
MKLKNLLKHNFVIEFRSHLETEFEDKLFVSALRNFCSYPNPLRFNNFAFAMRELLRHVLNRKAPDERVSKCIWFSPTFDDPEKANRGQKLKYCMQAGLQDHILSEHVRDGIKNYIAQYQDHIETLNLFTHVGEATFGLGPQKAYQKLKELIITFNEAMEIIQSGKEEVLSFIPEKLADYVEKELLEEILQSLDELSTHTFIDYLEFDGFQVTAIDESFIYIQGGSTVYVDLQYGSSSDRRKGDGVAISDSFPVYFQCKAKANKPKGAFVIKESIVVSAESWWK